MQEVSLRMYAIFGVLHEGRRLPQRRTLRERDEGCVWETLSLL